MPHRYGGGGSWLLLRLAVLILLLLLLRCTPLRGCQGRVMSQPCTRAGRAVAGMKACGCAVPATSGVSAPVVVAVWVHV